MKAFVCKPSFSSAYEEYLDIFMSIFDTLEYMCAITPEEKLEDIPAIFYKDPVSLFSRKVMIFETYKKSDRTPPHAV